MNAEADNLWSRACRALKTATMLVDEDPDSAASRAYYAAFFAMSAWFSDDGKSFSKHSALEAAVHRDLVKSGILDAQNGADFSWLINLRSTGDYGGETHVSYEDAQKAVGKAQEIIAVVAQKKGFQLQNQD
jgi:uncharacterized protein (UPF0332 family)